MSIDIIKQQTKDLIDRLKSTTNNIGLGNSGNEYTVIVETFLYKFLNDKFIYEAKRTLPELADAEDVYEALERLPDEEYEEMCDMMLDTIVLKKEHLIPYLAKRQNEDNFATLFDATLEAIADTNEEIFYILNEDETRISIMKPLSEVVTGGSAKKNGFCKSLIGDVASFSFEAACICCLAMDLFGCSRTVLLHGACLSTPFFMQQWCCCMPGLWKSVL